MRAAGSTSARRPTSGERPSERLRWQQQQQQQSEATPSSSSLGMGVGGGGVVNSSTYRGGGGMHGQKSVTPEERLRAKMQQDSQARLAIMTPEERLRDKMRMDSQRQDMGEGKSLPKASAAPTRSAGTTTNAYERMAEKMRQGERPSVTPEERLRAKMQQDSEARLAIMTPEERLRDKMRMDSQRQDMGEGRSLPEASAAPTRSEGTTTNAYERMAEKMRQGERQSVTPEERLRAKMQQDSEARLAKTSASSPSSADEKKQGAHPSRGGGRRNKVSGVGFSDVGPSSRLDGLSKSDKQSIAVSLGVGAVLVPGIGNASVGGETMPSFVTEESGFRSTFNGDSNAYDEEAASYKGYGKFEGRKDESYPTVCGLTLTRRRCLLIATLLGVAVAVIVVGAMAGTDAFSGSGDGTAASEGLPNEGGAVGGQQSLPPMSEPTASPTAHVPPECRQNRLSHADAKADDYFGRSVAVDGDTAMVGADAGQNDVTVPPSGSVYVYTRGNAGWKEEARLRSDENLKGNLLGRSVALDGDTAVFGAVDRGADNLFEEELGVGCAFVFKRAGAAWEQQAKLLPDDTAQAGVAFGSTVAVYGDTVIIGSDFSDKATGVNSGFVYVFTRSDDTWTQQEKIVLEDGMENDRFGHSVALYDNTAVIGAVRADANGENSGAAYVFTRSGGKWMQQAKLLADDGAANDAFGKSVAIQGETIVVGAAKSDDDNNYDSGSAYVFVRRSRTAWTQQAKLVANDASYAFGESVSLDGDTTVVGSKNSAAYVFGRMGTTWTQQTMLLSTLHDAGDGGGGDENYGENVGLSGGTLIIGAHTDDWFDGEIGNAYAIKLC